MTRIIASFETFLKSNCFIDGAIDMSPLFDDRTSWTPVNLEYANKIQSIQHLSGGIISNLSETYKNSTLFRKRLIDHLCDIVLGEADANRIAQRMCLLQCSKRKFGLDRFTYMLVCTSSMKIKNVLGSDEIQWLELGRKVLIHKEINQMIDQFIKKSGLPLPTKTMAETKITFVEKSIATLRGFVGIEEIYIHVDNFHNKIAGFRGSLSLLHEITKMDLISVFIHQLAHLKIRTAANDLNFHTPMVASLASIPPAPHEFGAYVESEVFGKQVAWYESASTLEENGKQYITSFIAAIEENVSIPNYFVKDQLVARYESPYSCSSSGMVLESRISTTFLIGANVREVTAGEICGFAPTANVNRMKFLMKFD